MHRPPRLHASRAWPDRQYAPCAPERASREDTGARVASGHAHGTHTSRQHARASVTRCGVFGCLAVCTATVTTTSPWQAALNRLRPLRQPTPPATPSVSAIIRPKDPEVSAAPTDLHIKQGIDTVLMS